MRHGQKGSPTWITWQAMRQRCKRKPEYIRRGITVCERWETFINFRADMGDRPVGMTIDRIDNDAGYAPENCRWATPIVQRQGTGETR